jgi:hypothetical protein
MAQLGTPELKRDLTVQRVRARVELVTTQNSIPCVWFGVDKVLEIVIALVLFVLGEMLIRRVKRYLRERRKP